MIFPFVLLFLDGLYLMLIYTTHIIKLKKINYIAMAICYCFVLFTYYYFIYLPKKSPNYAFILGFVINGIYETTNLSIIENWPVSLVILDTLWGGILFYLVTIISNLNFIKIFKTYKLY